MLSASLSPPPLALSFSLIRASVIDISFGCNGFGGEAEKAEQWEDAVSEHTAMTERYLGFQQPGSVYRFEDAGNGSTERMLGVGKLALGENRRRTDGEEQKPPQPPSRWMDVDTDPPVAARHTCLKLHVGDGEGADAVVFVKGTWFPSRFQLSITDGLDAWVCDATEAEVRQRAEQWDQPVSEYTAMAERYLGFQQPGSVYRFEDAGNGQKRLSWTFEKLGTRLEWRWKCQPSLNSQQITREILDFLMDANIRLSEEVISIRQSFDKLKLEAEKCLSQSEKFSKEKLEFESSVYAKFVEVLNSKKAKLRDLARSQNTDKAPQDEEDSSEKTDTFDEASADELNK